MDSLLFINDIKKLVGIIGISAAIDFTSRLINNLSPSEYQNYIKKAIQINSKYSKNPYIFTKLFIQDAKKYLLLKKE